MKQQIENMTCPGLTEICPAPLSSTKNERKGKTKNEEEKRSVHCAKYAKTYQKTNTTTIKNYYIGLLIVAQRTSAEHAASSEPQPAVMARIATAPDRMSRLAKPAPHPLSPDQTEVTA